MTWLESLVELTSPEERGEWLAQAPADAAAQLHEAVLRAVHHNPQQAARLSAALLELASIRVEAKPWAARAQGHIEHTGGRHAEAIDCYRRAAQGFELAGAESEVGRTLLGGIQALIYRGEYDEALNWATRAEQIFERNGDRLRLARLDSNIGNILFRQDLPREAARRYRKALAGFEHVGGAADAAATLSNLAVASISLGMFSDAMEAYQKARDHYQQQGPPNLLARAEYNIAYLYYMRGQYSEARTLYEASRERCKAVKDFYHATLCDLDESEMLLELNLTGEGEALAKRAAQGFSKLGLRYEQAKALVNLAVAASQRRDLKFAGRQLIAARRLFSSEKNTIWVALVDQLRAVTAFHERRFAEARRLSSAAWRVLANTLSPGRAAHSQILMARLWLRAGYANRARAMSREAVERAGDWVSPSLRFHSHLVQGEIHELNGDSAEALTCYENARAEVEGLRNRLESEDLRISILQDKLGVYEGLVSLRMEDLSPESVSKALDLVEQAKSRSLADCLAAPAELPSDFSVQTARGDLDFIYRQIQHASLDASEQALDTLRERAVELEQELTNAAQKSQRIAPSAHAHVAVQDVLEEGEVLVEFYEARATLYAFLVSQTSVNAVCLGTSDEIRKALKLLRFQLSKRGWAVEPDVQDLEAVSHHLRELYRLLIAPLEASFAPYRHIVFAPHRELHGLPFAALDNGAEMLIDRFTVSVIPSANVLALCRRPRPSSAVAKEVLVMAAADARAPQIAGEGRFVAGLFPGARVLLNEDATVEAFRLYAPRAGIVHLAAHGVFRRDNPLFSAIQLADSWLNLLDLSQIRLDADLLTLSACNTGTSVAIGGDELMGLLRGFLQAGARSLLVTLWEVDDAITKEFMEAFYTGVQSGARLPEAVRGAMRTVRARHPHPYYWAAFLLVGDSRPAVHYV